MLWGGEERSKEDGWMKPCGCRKAAGRHWNNADGAAPARVLEGLLAASYGRSRSRWPGGRARRVAMGGVGSGCGRRRRGWWGGRPAAGRLTLASRGCGRDWNERSTMGKERKSTGRGFAGCVDGVNARVFDDLLRLASRLGSVSSLTSRATSPLSAKFSGASRARLGSCFLEPDRAEP